MGHTCGVGPNVQWQRVAAQWAPLIVGVRTADGPSWASWPRPGPKRNNFIFYFFLNEVKLVLIQKQSFQAQKN
jgi:hypothetical protein